LHTPFKQLHLFPPPIDFRHLPVPEIPSSHCAQLSGHFWQLGPKNPEAQASQACPVKPDLQVHSPWGLQTPADEHGGAHVVEYIFKSENWAEFRGDGRCCVSGIESHRMIWFEDEAVDTIAMTSNDSANEWAFKDVVEPILAMLDVDIKAAWPA